MINREVALPLVEQAAALADPAEKASAFIRAHYICQQLRLLPQLGLGGKAPRLTSNGFLHPEDTDNARATQEFLSEFLDSTNPARKTSSR